MANVYKLQNQLDVVFCAKGLLSTTIGLPFSAYLHQHVKIIRTIHSRPSLCRPRPSR